MALIPPDAGIRMRMQAEASLLQPTAPAPELPSDLPDLRTGQTFTARIQDVLPENTYKALVAGKLITLQLPEGAKAGDTLELVVIDRTPKVIIAQLAEQAAAPAANEPYQYATLSRTAQMIGNLLLPEGETHQPATLNRGEPLLPQPPTSAADLVPALQKAVTQSGLFYESHQAQWVGGKLPVAQLLQEPQGQRSAPATLAQHGVMPGMPPLELGRTAAAAPAQHGAPPELQAQNAGRPATAPAASPTILQTLFGGGDRAEAAPPQQATTLVQGVPDELRPIVQQQLDAVATQRLIWHGEAWPSQRMDWEIVREDERNTGNEVDAQASWRTTLRLDTPRLGHVDASLRLTAAGISMTLATPDDTSAAAMRNAVPKLAASLDAAGITLLSLQVKHEPGE